MSACASASPTGKISVKFDIADLSENLSSKSKFRQNRTQISVIMPEDLSTFYCCRRR